MKTELNDYPDSKTPRYEKLAARFRENIMNNVWPAGTKIPSKRILAKMYAESEDVVLNACHMLFREHLLVTRNRKGTYVTGLLLEDEIKRNLTSEPNYDYEDFSEPDRKLWRPAKRTAIRLDLSSPEPDARLLDKLRKCYISRKATSCTSDITAVKEAIVECVRPSLIHRDIALDARQICLTEGEFTILHHIASLLRENEGEFIVVPAFVNPMVVRMIRSAGLNVMQIDLNSYDQFFQSLSTAAYAHRVKGVFLETRCDGGTGIMFPEAGREALLGLARTCRFPIVEIDYDYEFSYRPFRLLFADAPDIVIYVSCISKLTHSMYDVKYAAGPAEVIRSLRHLSESCSRAAECRLMAIKRVIEQPGMEEAARLRAERCREAAVLLKKQLCNSLKNRIDVFLPDAGTGMFLYMPPATDGQMLKQLLYKDNIYIKSPALRVIDGVERMVLKLDYSNIDAAQAETVAPRFITAFRKSAPYSDL
ncbi:aminotransferase class I/II-fold pyridoxal phosphate-dependent enzyme [Arcticibacter tournemirensis]|uniref:Aminotransferase class I/II-fold pyridoxal phosphate-dependent enzyme n=1 Tax=Arcticibacter tournemirensis TaxID=699437 RepID=A0A4Q0M4A1_9SPHI|nr:aminotransferase class I/II-fold pyridoxal phosphate-dependent enzyme [Arcticibacter tournemirensis]RXF67715.1 aminotransferase class I/II-fold pyridoxal phosphate-dependent enzyme [Arcticibacter tournemirensis]